MGRRRRYGRGAGELLIVADGGGSNGSRDRPWEVAPLRAAADATGLVPHVCHLPPGTSKWNKIERRLFCHVTRNWRGRPPVTHDVIVSLVGSTTTAKGLKVRAAPDGGRHPTGTKVTDGELAAVNIKQDEFHGDWNYTISLAVQGSAKVGKLFLDGS